jgi:putative DNA primase/helicase
MMNGHHQPYVQAAIEGEISQLACAVTGERNDALFKSTASLASLGVREGEILRHLKPVAENLGLRGSEIYSTVKSGVKAGRESPRDVPDPFKKALKGALPTPSASIALLQRSKVGEAEQPPAFCIGTANGPPVSADEERRHLYRRNGSTIRVKIKRRGGRYVNWYRVTDGWQAGKPEGYEPCPYTGTLDAFDSEFRTEVLYWPEGEKDCDTLSREGLPAFTFGGTGDGLPAGIDHYLAGRDLVILADNDVGGRKHAVKKAGLAQPIAKSVRIVEFRELPEKADVTDFLVTASLAEFEERVRQTPLWAAPPEPSNASVPLMRELVTCNLSDVTPEKIDWLWPGRLAIGKLTILAGEPGLGKSQMAIYIASTVTRGSNWIGTADRPRRARVLMLSAEDGLADTVRPRFDAAGGDASMVSVIRSTESAGVPGRNRGTFNLAADLMLLEREIERHGDVDLVVIDPLSSYMLNVDSHRNTDVRAVLEPMEEMAERMKVAILATTHLSKGDGKAINRIIGSIAFVAAARAVFTVVEDPDEEGRRLLLHVKNNIARPQPGLAFRLEQREIAPGILGSAVAWDETASVSVTADQALSGISGQSSTKCDAVEFLLDVLSAGPMDVREIEQHAVSASLLTEGRPIGQSKPFRLARGQLGIQPRRSGGLGSGGRWVWELPGTKVPSQPYDAPNTDEGTLGSDGHLSVADGSSP